jgi:hypothetical protein
MAAKKDARRKERETNKLAAEQMALKVRDCFALHCIALHCFYCLIDCLDVIPDISFHFVYVINSTIVCIY